MIGLSLDKAMKKAVEEATASNISQVSAERFAELWNEAYSSSFKELIEYDYHPQFYIIEPQKNRLEQQILDFGDFSKHPFENKLRLKITNWSKDQLSRLYNNLSGYERWSTATPTDPKIAETLAGYKAGRGTDPAE